MSKDCLFFVGVAVLWLSTSVIHGAKVGEKAPDFQGKDSHGKTWRLSDAKGKFLVLEWHNHDCPFTQSQYKGKMQKLQQEWTAKGVLWLRVISSAPGKEGYVSSKQANLDAARNGCAATATLLDPKGVIGRAYGAKTTPHLFIIDTKGNLIYNGAVDNAPLDDDFSVLTKEGKPYENYVEQGLFEATGGAKVSIPSTVPYGCGIKYQEENLPAKLQ